MVGEATIPLSSLEDLDWCRRFERLLSLRLPDLTGKSVLDVSALDGYFSFAAERFGASRVTNVDVHGWHRPGSRARFELARDALASRVEDLGVALGDISPGTVGSFDVVLFLGDLNHMREPLGALEALASVTKELLVVDTLVSMTFTRSAIAAGYPWTTFGKASSWRSTNPDAVVALLHDVGFALVLAYPPEQLSVTDLLGLPTSARRAARLLSSTPPRSRARRAWNLARGLVTERHLVTHSRR